MKREIIAIFLSFCAGAAIAQAPPVGKRMNIQCMEKPGMQQSLARFEKAFQRIRDRNPANDNNVDELHKSYRYYARIHNGPPGRAAFCNHMNELFLTWHRAALRIFEMALQEADKENGGDGGVTLPYWNWAQPATGKFYPLPFERDAALQPMGDPRRDDARTNPRYRPDEVQAKMDNARTWRQFGGKPCIDPDCRRRQPIPAPPAMSAARSSSRSTTRCTDGSAAT